MTGKQAGWLQRNHETLVVGVSVANFISHVALGEFIGGDAITGTAQGGRYFLNDHGRLNEVDEPVYSYSLWHAYVLWANWAALCLYGAMTWIGRSHGPRQRRLG